MTNSINEIENAEVILVSGSNTTEAHPQVARRMLGAVDRGARLIVIDPRRTRLAECSHLHLALRPGTDILLLNAMMRVLLDEGLADELFIEMRTENFLALRDMLHRLDLAKTAALTGVPLALISQAALLYGRARKAVICYCLGVTQHVCGTENVQTIANLAMLAGHIEKKDTGVDPLRGQNNVQGACDMGALPNMLPSYQPVHNEDFREKFELAWGTRLPAARGLNLVEMTHGGGQGAIRGMYIMGENPMLSDPTLTKVEETLRGLDFLAVSDIFLTETAQLAQVVFPAACFAEKSGSFTNTERRVQMVRRAVAPPGQCRADSEIIIALANRLGYAMDYDSSAEIMEEIALLAPIYGGIYHDRLDRGWGLQWPCWDRDHPGTPFLHKYYFTRGKGYFMPTSHIEPGELPDLDYPLLLMTGRIYHQYHTGTMTRKSERLSRESGQALLQINPADAMALGLRRGETVRLVSRRGEISLATEITEQVDQGMVYTTFHFHEAPINLITNNAFDTGSGCPEYKVCAVRVEKMTAA
ncbi:MAG: formate dehydrogenase [Deltaproteobacteria bacterium RIFOXYD12_FULL_56_24]|nr:MAG: formate dehydrogenase [Deltaproteobacteria bacterium RIFOXYD12_FULL_56_24]